MAALIDETGNRYGRLRVVGIANREKGRAPKYLCECDCGGEVFTDGTKLRSGDVRSCGCIRKETTRDLGKRTRKHGKRNRPEYGCWANMKGRCDNPRNFDYVNYGGRGIEVCSDWQSSFEAFYRDMGPRPSSSHSIDRIDTNGNYEPGNCRWATPAQQNNNRRTSRWIEFDGKRQTLADWAREAEISSQCLLQRLRVWSLADALTTPKGEKRMSQRL